MSSADHLLKPGNTREALLRAAIVLFSEHGIDAVSVRDITRAAGASLGAITYHFSSKDELIREVYRRVHEPFRNSGLAALDAYEASLGGAQPDAEMVLRALIGSMIKLIFTSDRSGAYAIRLAYQAYALRRPMIDAVVSEQLDDYAKRFMAALARALPGVSYEQIGWRYYFTIGATLHIAFDAQRASRLRRLTDGLCDTSDPDQTIKELVEFVLVGIRGGRNNTVPVPALPRAVVPHSSRRTRTKTGRKAN